MIMEAWLFRLIILLGILQSLIISFQYDFPHYYLHFFLFCFLVGVDFVHSLMLLCSASRVVAFFITNVLAIWLTLVFLVYF